MLCLIYSVGRFPTRIPSAVNDETKNKRGPPSSCGRPWHYSPKKKRHTMPGTTFDSRLMDEKMSKIHVGQAM